MKEIEVVTTVKIAGTTTIELKTTIEAQVDYTFEEPLPANGNLEIWIRAGTQDELKFLTIKAATKDDSGNWQKHYPMIGACPAISFKARHKHPDGKSKYSDAIHLKDDTPFFRQSGDHPSDQLYTNDVEELESLVFDNNSNEDIEQIQIYVARNGQFPSDAGHELEIRKLMRRLRVYNPVPSKYGGGARNIPLLTLIEDPVPRDSFHAQFIQLCDYLAYALLRREEPVLKYPGLDQVFAITDPIVLKQAAQHDPDGIVRLPRK